MIAAIADYNQYEKHYPCILVNKQGTIVLAQSKEHAVILITSEETAYKEEDNGRIIIDYRQSMDKSFNDEEWIMYQGEIKLSNTK